MARLPDLDPATLTPEQQPIYDAILNGPRGIVEGPLKVWLTSPGLADRAQALGAFCRYGTTLAPRLSELAILVTGAHWRAGFEWHVHHPIALKAGVDADAAEAIRTGADPVLTREDEAALYAFCRELLTAHAVAPATYARAQAALGDQALVELVGVLGYYGLISMTIKAFETPIPDGGANPFADLGASS